ncbi:MAG: MBL fold metallo-hydrolase [Bacteroides sp.]|nr:MBL fold metallo-hydrolase [Ruminococcus flavefaciens]MCM1554747.1 MBL fold metallo-hydrolase [Bacteroides sp.]
MNAQENELQVKCMPVNPIEMNLYVVYRKNGEGFIVDPGCCRESEFERLYRFIEQENIQISHILLTHPHFDHFWGAAEVCRHFGLPLHVHEKALGLIEKGAMGAASFGLPPVEVPENIKAFEGSKMQIAGTALEVRYTPGHCEGSVCFVLPEIKTVFSGDVLFNGSIGRTDLPTGDFDLLKKSIFEQLFVLDEGYSVRPGHGGRTWIEQERYQNPFL